MILDAYRHGCIYDAWTEQYHHDRWMEAFERQGIDWKFYVLRKRTADEIFPWDFIDCGVTKRYLLREWEHAQKGEITKNCREQCSGCGAASYQCGICVGVRN